MGQVAIMRDVHSARNHGYSDRLMAVAKRISSWFHSKKEGNVASLIVRLLWHLHSLLYPSAVAKKVLFYRLACLLALGLSRRHCVAATKRFLET